MRVYYSGDMANVPGWFTATAHPQGIQLTEEEQGDGRQMVVTASQIGNRYEGHCNPRFVTEDAVSDFYTRRAIR